ncbi:MAG: transketolase [Bacteroidetes bacterium]|nr:MAG: transketolase [Bacteroidota bacterium]
MTTKELAKRIRIHAVKMTSAGKSSHVGSVLSIADILAVLYNDILKVDPAKPDWKDRDRFILSKGHAGTGVYAVLAEKGFFSVEILKTHYQNGSLLSGHVSHKGIPGVELSTGSLGHGLSVGTGLALAAKMDKKNYKTYVLLSDGECDEGSNWEAILFSAHHKLDNLVAIIDYNKIQSIASVKETLGLDPFADKWLAFGWDVKTVDGHNYDELKNALSVVPFKKNKPSVIIANTIKGKGVSFMEHMVLWHYRSPLGKEFEMALKELETQ